MEKIVQSMFDKLTEKQRDLLNDIIMVENLMHIVESTIHDETTKGKLFLILDECEVTLNEQYEAIK